MALISVAIITKAYITGKLNAIYQSLNDESKPVAIKLISISAVQTNLIKKDTVTTVGFNLSLAGEFSKCVHMFTHKLEPC